MQAVLETLEQYPDSREVHSLKGIGAKLGNWFSEIFGCAHNEMSRPFSRHGESYRVCINCGARRQFDPQTWNSSGRHYYKQARVSDLQDVDMTALRCI